MTAEHLEDWTTTESARLAHLLVAQPFIGSAAAVRRAIEHPDAWLGQRVTTDEPGSGRRYLTDLRLRIGDQPGRATFHKAAYVDLGRVRRIGEREEVEVSWRAATLAPLFPVFSGKLTFGGDELRLEGWYAPPGGAIGFVADRALLKIAARGTGRWFLDELVEAAERG
jgi:hypothetical protein